ncbi:nephrin-like protein, partial [Dinothrombium tinctorium]
MAANNINVDFSLAEEYLQTATASCILSLLHLLFDGFRLIPVLFLCFCIFFTLRLANNNSSESSAVPATTSSLAEQQFASNQQQHQYFRVKPVDTEVVEGDVAELHCQIGHQLGSVQWSKDGFLL